jgi:DNA-directed RNA polymerase specialized sigma24 family protein
MADKLLQQDGRPGRRFQTTHWSLVLRAGAAIDPQDARTALGKLIESYWYPLYAFARRRGHGDHDAMDLTQGFVAHLLAADGALESVAPQKGRFRTFLLASFTHFMANQRRAAAAIRRGGGTEPMSLTGLDFNTRYDCEPADPETPELLFQRSWVESLLAKVRGRLADAYRAAGKSELFLILEPHLTGSEQAVSRVEIARRLNLSAAAVGMALHRLRHRFGEFLREEIALTVNDPDEVEDELRSLMAIVG